MFTCKFCHCDCNSISPKDRVARIGVLTSEGSVMCFMDALASNSEGLFILKIFWSESHIQEQETPMFQRQSLAGPSGCHHYFLRIIPPASVWCSALRSCSFHTGANYPVGVWLWECIFVISSFEIPNFVWLWICTRIFQESDSRENSDLS